MIRRYTFKLYPNAAQAAALHGQRRMMAALYNALLQQRIEAYSRQGKTLGYYEQCKEITALRRDPECVEWRALSSSSMTATAQRLDHAYQAFFRRAKAGAGREAGFPRFKKSEDYPSIPFKRHRDCWCYEPGEGWRNGRLTVRGVPSAIKVRGKLPCAPAEAEVRGKSAPDIRSCELLWREERWWLSLVVAMPKRRAAGRARLRVTFDLVSEFARVREIPRDGGLAAGPEPVSAGADGRITPEDQRAMATAPAVAPDLRGDQGIGRAILAPPSPAVAPDLRGDQGAATRQPGCTPPAVAPDLRGDQGLSDQAGHQGAPAVAPDLRGDQGEASILAQHRLPAIAPESGIAALQQAMARCKRGSCRYRQLRRRKARFEAAAARRRNERLHEWTTAIIRGARSIEAVAPKDLKAATASARGTVRDPGAEIAFKAMINRRARAFAAGAAIAMLDYKSAEAGCDFVHIDARPHPLDTAGAIVAAAKEVRKAKRRAKTCRPTRPTA